MPTLSNEELDKKIREIHNRFHGRLRTHEDVARRAKWTPEELDGVHIQDEHIFYDEVKALIATQNTALLKELLEQRQTYFIQHSNNKPYSTQAVPTRVISSKLAAMGEQ